MIMKAAIPEVYPEIENNRRKETMRKKMTQADIEKIKNALKSDNVEQMKETHREIDAKYQSVIRNWGFSMNYFNPEYGFDLWNISQEDLIQNLNMMIPKLEMYITGENMAVQAQKEYYQDVNVNLSNNMNIPYEIEQRYR